MLSTLAYRSISGARLNRAPPLFSYRADDILTVPEAKAPCEYEGSQRD